MTLIGIPPIRTIWSQIFNLIMSVGKALASFANYIVTKLGPILEKIPGVLETVNAFANAFLKILDIFKPDENVEDLGERAIQAAEAGITVDKFENFQDYMEALRKFEINPEEAEKRSRLEKVMVGIAVATVGIEDAFNAERGSLNDIWLLPMSSPQYFTPERMKGLIASGRLAKDILGYLEGRLSAAESRAFEKGLEVNAQGQPLSDEKDLNTLYQALDEAKNQWAKWQENQG